MDLQPYSHFCFSKISITLFDFCSTYWVSLFQRNNSIIFLTWVFCFSVILFYSTLLWTGVSCFSVILFYSTLLALTHRQKDRQRNAYTCYAWAGGTFFPVVLLCQFSVLAGNRFWFYEPLMYFQYPTVVVLCQFFLIVQDFFFGTHVLSVQYSCAVVSVFCYGGKANVVQIFLLNTRIFFSCYLLCMDLQPYSHDCFSKILRTLFDFLNNTYWVSLF